MKLRRLTTIEALRYRVAELEAQVAGLEQMNHEKAAEIRRLRMGNHPAGRALRQVDDGKFPGRTYHGGNGHAGPGDEIHALAEALTERDAEHEGGGGA